MAKSKEETVISKGIAEALEKLGFIVIRMQSGIIKASGGRFIHLAPKGTPDRIAMGPNGLTIWFEIKKEDGKLSKEQIEWHKKLTELGHKVFTVTSAAEAVDKAKGLL